MKKFILIVVLFAIYAIVAAKSYRPPMHISMKPRLTTTAVNPRTASRFGKVESVPLTGNLTFWGEYFVSLGIGTPPQFVNLQVDTGSTDLIVYGSDCGKQCGNPALSYNDAKSSTSMQVSCDTSTYLCDQQNCWGFQCGWEDSFGDGSTISGYVDTDVFTIGDVTTQSTGSLGVINSVDAPNGFEATGVDGILGLAFSQLSGWGGSTAYNTFVMDFNWYDGFSMCLLYNNGVFSLGTDYTKDPRFVWTPISDEEWFGVTLNDWKMNNKSLGISSWDLNWNGVIVDSGTTLLIVSSQIFKAIRTVLEASCSTSTPLVGVCNQPAGKSIFDSYCFTMTQQQVNQFPQMAITFPLATTGQIDLFLNGNDYLWQGSGTLGQYCLGIQADDDLPIIIGDIFIQNYHTVFDKNSGNIGFGPLSSCPKPTF